MSVLMKGRHAALAVMVGVAAVAACRPVVPVSPAVGLTPAQLDSLLATRTWVGCATVERNADGGRTNVEICADLNARKYGRGNPPGGNAWIPVAIMKNIGTLKEARWGLLGGRQYAIFIDPTATRYWIVGPDVSTQSDWISCNHGASTVSKASFGTCAENPGNLPPSATGKSPGRGPEVGAGDGDGVPSRVSLDGPAWVSCTEGCCTTEAH